MSDFPKKFYSVTLLLKGIIGCGFSFDLDFSRLDLEGLFGFGSKQQFARNNERASYVKLRNLFVIVDFRRFENNLYGFEATSVVKLYKAESFTVADSSRPTRDRYGFARKRFAVGKNTAYKLTFHFSHLFLFLSFILLRKDGAFGFCGAGSGS